MIYVLKAGCIIDFMLICYILGKMFFGPRVMAMPLLPRALFFSAQCGWAIWSGLLFFIAQKSWSGAFLGIVTFGVWLSVFTQYSVLFFHHKARLWEGK